MAVDKSCGEINAENSPSDQTDVDLANGGFPNRGYVNEAMEPPFTGFTIIDIPAETTETETTQTAEPQAELSKSISSTICEYLVGYKRQIFNVPTLFTTKTRPSIKDQIGPSFHSLFGAFVGMIMLTVLHFIVLTPLNTEHSTFYSTLSFSFGASAVLLYDVPESPLSQPRNVVGGHLLSAIVGLTFRQFLSGHPYLSCALAVALSIQLMRLSGTTHPPGGATAAIAAVSRDFPFGPAAYLALILPFLIGAIWLVLVAVVVNNLFRGRQYPIHWL